jgi:hypothetical protein
MKFCFDDLEINRKERIAKRKDSSLHYVSFRMTKKTRCHAECNEVSNQVDH